MDFNQVSKMISSSGYKRTTSARTMMDDEGNIQKVYDYECIRGFDMFSVYLDESGTVIAVEFTKVNFNRETRKLTPVVTKIDSMKSLKLYLKS